MPEEPTPAEPLLSEEHPQPDPSDPGAGPGRPHQSIIPVVAICAVIALPFAYLLMHRSKPDALQVRPSAAPPAAAAISIPVLEQIARAQPTADNRLNLSLAYINANQPASAIPVLQALVAEDAANAKAWNNLCVAHTMQAEYNHAIDDCRHALTLDPGLQLAQNNLRWAEGQNQKALDAIAAADKTPPASRDANSYLAEGLDAMHAGNYDKALQLWQQALARDPHSATAANDIGVAYMMKHRPSDAIPWFNKAAALDPGLQLAKNNLAWANSELRSAPAK